MARVKSHTIIDDPALDPYFITRDEYNYIVNEKITTDANHFRSKGGSKEYDKAIDEIMYADKEEERYSRWYQQTPVRVKDFVEAIENIKENV